MMEIVTETVQGQVPVTIIRLNGKLDSSSAGFFDEQIRRMVYTGVKDILLDFSAVPFMSSVGIRSLSMAYDWLHPMKSGEQQKSLSQAVHDGTYHAPHLKLLNPNPAVLKTIKVVALDRYLEIFNDETLAIGAFG